MEISGIALAMMVLLAWGGVARGDAPVSLMPAGEDLQCGYLDAGGKVVLSGFASAGDFSEGLAPVKMGGGYGFIDKTGKAVIPPRYRGSRPVRGWSGRRGDRRAVGLRRFHRRAGHPTEL